MPAPVHESQNRAYYDAFSARYEAQRGTRSDGGYHVKAEPCEHAHQTLAE